MSSRTLEPKWWRQEPGALTDVADGLLFDRRCQACGQRRGTRIVNTEDEPDGRRRAWWCARCICEDMPPIEAPARPIEADRRHGQRVESQPAVPPNPVTFAEPVREDNAG